MKTQRGIVDVKDLLEGALAEKVRGVTKKIVPLIIHQVGEDEALRMNIVNAMRPEYAKAKKLNKLFDPEKSTIARFANILTDVSTAEEFEERVRQVFKRGNKIKSNPYVLFQVYKFAWKTKFDLPPEEIVIAGRLTVKKLSSMLLIMENRLKQADEERIQLLDKITSLDSELCAREGEIAKLKEAAGAIEKQREEKIIVTSNEKEGKIIIEIFK